MSILATKSKQSKMVKSLLMKTWPLHARRQIDISN